MPPREGLRHGTVSCSKSNFIISVCTFKCTELGYSLFPKNIRTNKCLPSTKWDSNSPCCTRPCPPNAKMDAFFILDSSSSIGAENWVIMTRFVREFLTSFTISKDTAQFAVVRYNAAVDTSTQIQLNDYPDDKTGLLAAFDKLPYNGSGTRTGQAIKHVLDNMMGTANGNRPDVLDLVIVITDGKSQDEVLVQSNALRRRGALTYAVGVNPPRGAGLDMDQLVEIAGDERNVLVADGFYGLVGGIDAGPVWGITEKVCGDPCDA